MYHECRVLVTGAGSGVGQGIVKALRLSPLPVKIISADIAAMNAALYRADEAIMIPRFECAGAFEQTVELLRRHRIDVVMVGSEFDLAFMAENKAAIEAQTGAKIVVAPASTVRMADDKWLTAEFLRERGLPYGQAYLPESVDDAATLACQWGYPIVLKTRQGTSSRHVYIINEERMLREMFPVTPQPMLQRMLERPSAELKSEYTCSIFKTGDGTVLGPFTARRTVRGGSSWHVEVRPFAQLNETLLAIGGAVDFVGSLNVQLMLTPSGPIPFEINARFSGTTAIRAHFGFNEPEMALKSFFYNEKLPPPVIRSGIALRYLEEVFVDNVQADQVKPGSHIGRVNRWF